MAISLHMKSTSSWRRSSTKQYLYLRLKTWWRSLIVTSIADSLSKTSSTLFCLHLVYRWETSLSREATACLTHTNTFLYWIPLCNKLARTYQRSFVTWMRETSWEETWSIITIIWEAATSISCQEAESLSQLMTLSPSLTWMAIVLITQTSRLFYVVSTTVETSFSPIKSFAKSYLSMTLLSQVRSAQAAPAR